MNPRGHRTPELTAQRHWPVATNVLVLHGSEAEREEVAREVHATNPAPLGTYTKLDCRREQSTFQAVIRQWISEDGRGPEPAALLGDGRGTLFLDRVEALSDESQGLLSHLLERLAESSALGLSRPIGRLIAGSRHDLRMRVISGHFRSEVYDALNKSRVDLRSRARARGHPTLRG